MHSLRRYVASHAMSVFFGRHRSAESVAGGPVEGVFRVLVCRITHSLGNTLLVTPLLQEIESACPGAEIDILTRSTVATDIFGAFRSVGTIHRLPVWGFSHPWQFLGVLRRVRRVHYDLVIDPCPRSQTGRWMLLLAKGRFKLGFAGKRKAGSITHPIQRPGSIVHVGQLPVFLFRKAVGGPEHGPYPTLSVEVSPAERELGHAMLSRLTAGESSVREKKGVIGIFANATGPKLLGSEWWRGFMRELSTRYVDYSIVEIVPMFGRSMLEGRYPAYYSTDIRKLASVLSALSLFISADCGVMHLACASGVPVAGIFTVTDAEEWGPYGSHDHVIRALNLSPEQVAEQVAHNCLTPQEQRAQC